MGDTNVEVLERLRAKDALLFSLSDTLDVKASIALVLITFLATQSSGFLASALPGRLAWVQLVSAVLLGAGAIFALASLWPRDHDTETAEALDEWTQQLREHFKGHPDPEAEVEAEFRSGMIKRLKERIATNARIDRTKSRFMEWSYKLSGVAMLLNMTTLIALASS